MRILAVIALAGLLGCQASSAKVYRPNEPTPRAKRIVDTDTAVPVDDDGPDEVTPSETRPTPLPPSLKARKAKGAPGQ